MNEVEQRQSHKEANDAHRCLSVLLDEQIGNIGLRQFAAQKHWTASIYEEKRRMARQQLLSAYVDVANSLQAQEMGDTEKELNLMQEAENKILKMRGDLQGE
jgi:hypothetical protein